MDIYTIGHSTHSSEEFTDWLKAYKIETLVDVRSYPGSKHMPQFNKENMEKWIPEQGIRYLHMPELGGRRKKNREIDESLINGWRNPSFRNYAAYSLTEEYEKGISGLMAIEDKERLCYMCSESVPWRCHRLVISNTLVLKGLSVHHIMTEKKTILHEIGMYGAKAVREGSKLIYPKQQEDMESSAD
ncbi:DUF488 domain-containing protein [Carnobacterium antarcticum]|uniref:DUF488 family protein n=1 Tax=Carnobacterium antarcticum TaxID=2126436 RepID=A0ABW4NJU4_9LACT|nr:DUF488 domain-containing protein [Carnobacterium sp. CP1]ALV22395.1 hypothetical protein NY10_1797 [Carnobacterium sp. CP1]